MAVDRPGVDGGTVAVPEFRERARPGPQPALPWIAPVAALAVLATLCFAAGQRVGFERAARAAAAVERVAPLRADVAEQAARVAAERQRAELALRGLLEQIAALQADIVRMEARAGPLVARAELDEQFDLAAEPPLGGPEEAEPGHGAGTADVPATAAGLAQQVEDRRRKLAVLEDLLLHRALDSELRPEGRPVASAYVSSRFGERIDPFTGRRAMHNGIDFAARPGSEVVAVASGIVVWSGPREGYGQMIEIDHGRDYVTRYAHNAENLVAVGEVVSRGQPIARLGATGRATGPNLHFEVLRNGRAVNPLPFID
ncbi:MAG TPA: peptidoglycan DD-metalloendopeptidase family protein [Burkholderiales bacterium]